MMSVCQRPPVRASAVRRSSVPGLPRPRLYDAQLIERGWALNRAMQREAAITSTVLADGHLKKGRVLSADLSSIDHGKKVNCLSYTLHAMTVLP